MSQGQVFELVEERLQALPLLNGDENGHRFAPLSEKDAMSPGEPEDLVGTRAQFRDPDERGRAVDDQHGFLFVQSVSALFVCQF